MGTCLSRSRSRGKYKQLVQKVRLLQQEIAVVMNQREEESKAYEQQVMAFTLKEAEWKRERKKLREEVKRLRKVGVNKSGGKDGKCCVLDCVPNDVLVEQMREERARRDEAIEKWKMLYLAIKTELDDLIQKTHQGGLYWRAEEEDFMEGIHKELKDKDEMIELLQAQVVSLEEEEYKRKREVDILRQSLRIMSNRKKGATPKYGITSSRKKAATPKSATPKYGC